MGTYCVVQGTLLSAPWWPIWEGNLEKSGDMYLCGRFTLLCTWNWHNIVNQLYPIKKKMAAHEKMLNIISHQGNAN